MNRIAFTLGTMLAALGLFQPLSIADAQDEERVGTILGVAYVDENEDGIWAFEETVLEGVSVELTDGETTLSASTGSLGIFAVDVAAGVWRVTALAPEGYELISPAPREVTVGPEGTTAAVLDFAFRAVEPLPSPTPEEAGPETDDGDEPEGGLEPEPSATPEGDELFPDDELEKPVVLPVSGAPLPGSFARLLALGGLFLSGTVLVVVGRRLMTGR